MKIMLQELSIHDGIDVYEMLQEIPKDENGFVNGCYGRDFDDYKEWLIKSVNAAKGIGLEEWMVPQTVYWLFVNDLPVGYGKLRCILTEKLKEEGGHCGYAIRPSERKKGYGKLLLEMLVIKAKEQGVDKLLLTVRNHNTASIKVALSCGGYIEKINDLRHFIWVNCS